MGWGGARTGPLVMVWSVLNSIAWYYHSTQALPFRTIFLLAVIYAAGAHARAHGVATSFPGRPC